MTGGAEQMLLVPGFSVDWWALGVLMFEMMAGRSPFDIITDNPDMNTEEYLFQGKSSGCYGDPLRHTLHELFRGRGGSVAAGRSVLLAGQRSKVNLLIPPQSSWRSRSASPGLCRSRLPAFSKASLTRSAPPPPRLHHARASAASGSTRLPVEPVPVPGPLSQ